MQDRVSLYPGRVTMIPVDGQANTYDMTRADQPTQEGTPLNKASLLSDDTAQAMHLPQANPTVNDALSSLSGSVVSIGDMKTTMRNDLDDKWLLCNGEKFSQQQYPELYTFLSSKLSGVFFTEKDLWGNQDSHDRKITCVTYANGYWVVGGSYGDSSHTPYSARIAYATSLNGPWTTKDLWTSTSSSDQRVYDIVYANGYWAAVGENYRSATISYCTTLTGTWTTNTLWTGSSSWATAYCITYANGYWVVGGGYGADSSDRACSCINYATSLNGTWTRDELWWSNTSATGTAIYDVEYANGYWIAVGRENIGGGSKPDANISYSTNLTSWTDKTLSKGYFHCVTYAQGKWVVGGANSSGNAVVYFSEAPSGQWESRAITDGVVNCLTYQNGYFVAGITRADYGDCVLAYCTSLEDDWAIKKLWDGDAQYTEVNDIAYSNSMWLLGGQYGDGTNAYARIAYSDGVTLPVASTGDFYTYIRAKGATS